METLLYVPMNALIALSTEISSQDLLLFTIYCIFFCGIYHLTEQIVETKKGKSWLIMLSASFVLSLFGTYNVIHVITNIKWKSDFIYGEDFLTRQVILYFTASNFMDIAVGMIRYRSELDIITSVVHHAFYIVFMLVILTHHYSRGFVINFFMEIPTFVLGLGTVWKRLRSDYIFGVTFFLTRVLFNAFYAYKLYQLHPNGWIWKVCVLVLCQHLRWFATWWSKYGSYYNYGYNILEVEMANSLQSTKKMA